MAPDADIDPCTCVIGDHHASNLESADLTADFAMLHHDVESGLVQDDGSLTGDCGWFDRDLCPSDSRGADDPTVHGPDLWRIGKQRCPAGNDASGDLVIDEQMQTGRSLATGPDHRRAHSACRLISEQNPEFALVEHRRAKWQRRSREQGCVELEMRCDQPARLGREQPGALICFEWNDRPL